MLQSRTSLEKDVAAVGEAGRRSVLYFDVDDLPPVRTALESWPRVVPERTTFYGAREIIVCDPDGHLVFFGSHGEGA
jgi:hypothetical protein